MKKHCHHHEKSKMVPVYIPINGRPGAPGSPGPPGPNFKVHNTAFVDVKFGNNATALIESPAFPFQTIAAATLAISSIATVTNICQVQLRPGTYVENVHLRDFVNMLGITSVQFFPPPPSNEVFIQGTIYDDLIVNGAPALTDITVNSIEIAAGIFTSGAVLTLTDCVFNSIFATTTICVCLDISNGTGIFINRCSISILPGLATPFTATVIRLRDLGTAIVMNESNINLTLNPGIGVPDLTFITTSGPSPLSSPTVLSNSNAYAFGIAFPDDPRPATAVFQAFLVNNSSLVSYNDNIQFVVIPDNMPSSLGNLGRTGAAQQVDILNMIVNYVANIPPASIVSTLNNNGVTGSTGYFDNIRFRGFSGLVPTQTPVNNVNTFREITILVDDQAGGQDLAGVSIATATPYAVQTIDAVIIWTFPAIGDINLPVAAKYKGRRLTIKNASTFTITVTAAPGNTIDGVPMINLTSLQSVILVSDGVSTWWIIAQFV